MIDLLLHVYDQLTMSSKDLDAKVRRVIGWLDDHPGKKPRTLSNNQGESPDRLVEASVARDLATLNKRRTHGLLPAQYQEALSSRVPHWGETRKEGRLRKLQDVVDEYKKSGNLPKPGSALWGCFHDVRDHMGKTTHDPSMAEACKFLLESIPTAFPKLVYTRSNRYGDDSIWQAILR